MGRPISAPFLLRVAGVVLWLSSAVPAAGVITRYADRLGPGRVGLWCLAFGLFGALFWRTSGTVGTGSGRGELWSLGAQTVLAMSMFHIICSGFESALLVVIAGQLGFLVPLRVGGPWLVAMSLVQVVFATSHWATTARAVGWVAGTFGFEAFALLTAYLGASEARARGALSRTNAELRATRQIPESNTRMAERLRIARELHDVAGHHLTALSLNLEAAVHLTNDEARIPVEKARDVAKSLLSEVRNTVSSLRNDDAIDLTTAIATLANGVEELAIHIQAPEPIEVADSERAQAVLRCVQETITNALKHSGAGNLWIELRHHEDGLEIHPRDDGQGAQSFDFGHGLTGMRERLELVGGKLEIEPTGAPGFSLRATVPAS